MAKTLTHSRRRSKLPVLLEEERASVGVDVHKESYSVTVWTEDRGTVARWTQPAEKDLLVERLEPIRSQVDGVVYEAGPTGYELCRQLRLAGFPADVVAPSRTPRASGQQAKCDRLDSEQLALLRGKDMLSTVYVPTPEEEADRQVLRRRDQVVRWVRRVKSQIKSLLLQYGIPEPAGLASWSRASVQALRHLALRPGLRQVLDSLLDELASAEEQRRRLTALARNLEDTSRHAVGAAILRRVPGVGLLTTMSFLTELPQPQRFDRPAQVGSYLGFAPLVRQSGQTCHTGPIVKAGNRRLRTVLIQAAWQWIRYDPSARACYIRLKANTQSANKAIVGVARRLGILLWRLLTTGEVYTPPPVPAPAKGD